MSRLLAADRSLGACLAPALAAMLAGGCGTSGTEKAAPATKVAEEPAEVQLRKERERDLEVRKKLDGLKMPDQLAKEWFYDGDESFEMGAEWQADGSRVRLEVRRWMAKGMRPKGGTDHKPIVGFYVADFARGPYKYFARALDWELTLPQPKPLKDVQEKWYRCVVFDDTGRPEHFTDPVQVKIIDHNPNAVAPEKKSPEPKPAEAPAAKPGEKPAKAAAGAQPGEKPAKTATGAPTAGKPAKAVPAVPPAATRTRVIAVAPLFNLTEKDPLDRQYLGRGIAEALRELVWTQANVESPDPTYIDVVVGRQRVPQRQITANALTAVATGVGAEAVVAGSFQLTDKDLKIDLFVVSTETGAATMAQSVVFPNDASDDMAKAIAGEFAHLLRLDLDEAKLAKFSATWKTLNDRRQAIEQVLTLSKGGKHTEAVTAFEAIKSGDVTDPDVLLALSESYNQRGNPLEAARLSAQASHAPNWKQPPAYLETLGRFLGNAHDLKAALEVLAEVRLSPSDPVWQTACQLLDQSLAAKVVDRTWKGPQRTWPTVTPAWEATTDTMLTSPCVGGGRVAVLGSADRDVLSSVFSSSEAASHRGSVPTTFASAERYETYVYDLATGTLQWQKSKLLSGASTPLISQGVLYGMGPLGPVAVSLKDGNVAWEDKSGRVKPPDTVFATGFDYGRPWWKTFELRRTGTGLVVWHPRQDGVYFYDAAGGKYLGAAYHNGTWSMVGQFFLEKPDGLYFMKRGGGPPEKLSDERFANPMDLTRDLHMLADPDAAVEGHSLFEVTRQVTNSDTDRFDFFILASDADKGDFKWLYPLLGNQPPVIADGKLFIYKKSITGKPSMLIQEIDVDNQEAKTIDLSALDLGFYEPTLALPGGKTVLIGSQAAISTSDAKVAWVNSNLPIHRHPRIVGKYLFIPPVLVDPATGKAVMELQAVPPIDWQQALLAWNDDRLVVASGTSGLAGSRRGETRVEGKIRVYATGPAAAEAEAAGTEKPKGATVPAATTLADFEKAFMDSDLAPPLGPHMYDLFDRLALASYESAGDAGKAVEYLAGELKARPRNGEHVQRLLQILQPYVSMAGEYDQYLALLEAVKKDYAQDPQLVQAATDQAKAAQSEKLESANAAKYFETVRTAPHNPVEDWPSDRPANGTGNRGTGALPPFNVAWTTKIPRSGPLDRIATTEAAIFVLQDASHILTAFKPNDGSKLWDAADVRDFVYYRGVVYVVGKEMKAMTPREGRVLWRRRLTVVDLAGSVVMAAGQDMIFLAVRDGIETFDWTNGHDVYRLDLPGKNRIDVHGSVLVATATQTGTVHAFDAKTGGRLWSGDVGAYSLFDGKLYSLSLPPDSRPPDLLLTCYHVRTGRELWRHHYDLPAVARRPGMLAPAVTLDEILAVVDRNLLQFKRETGDEKARQALSADVAQPMQATPARAYLGGAVSKLVGFDLEKRLSPVWELPTTGREVVAVGDGTLYVLDKDELKAYQGEKESYGADDLKALAQPNEELTGAAAEIAKESNVRPAPFQGVGSIRDTKDLIGKLDDVRLSNIVFYELLHVGQLGQWKMMIDETMSNKPPGERKMRPLTPAELRLLYAEMIQRREPSAVGLVRDALVSNDARRTKMVIELMATGDRATYGPVLVQVFREALKKGQYATVASCAEAVGAWGHDPGEPLCIEGLEDDKAPDNTRAACADALGMFNTPTSLRALVKVARDDRRPGLARQCTDLLVAKGEDGIKAVGAILADASASDRSRKDAAEAFAKAKGPEAIPPLMAALNNVGKKYQPKVQAAAAVSLGPLSALRPDVLTALVAQMNNAKNDGYLRNACMAAIGSSKTPSVAVPLLIAAMGTPEMDNHKFTPLSAHQFLIQLTGERNVGQYQDEWQKWWEKNKDRFKPAP